MWIINIAIQIKQPRGNSSCMCNHSLDNQMMEGHKMTLCRCNNGCQEEEGGAWDAGIKVVFNTQHPDTQRCLQLISATYEIRWLRSTFVSQHPHRLIC